MFQHTAARRRLHNLYHPANLRGLVSTHSRTKAAALNPFLQLSILGCFNTQPHEGGCDLRIEAQSLSYGFQHTAARRRLLQSGLIQMPTWMFQHTAARRRLRSKDLVAILKTWFQHTAARRRLLAGVDAMDREWLFQHTAARRRLLIFIKFWFLVRSVSTHSRTKAAALSFHHCQSWLFLFQHTAARRRLPRYDFLFFQYLKFQHTAARRRLQAKGQWTQSVWAVSTHSRTKAAANNGVQFYIRCKFQHTAARRRLHNLPIGSFFLAGFNTQPHEGGCSLSIIYC